MPGVTCSWQATQSSWAAAGAARRRRERGRASVDRVMLSMPNPARPPDKTTAGGWGPSPVPSRMPGWKPPPRPRGGRKRIRRAPRIASLPSLARNTAWLTVAKSFSVAIYALFGLVLPRLVPAPVNGVYTLMSTLLFFGGMAASFGIPVILIRTIARDRSRTARIHADARRALLAGAALSSCLVLGWLLAEMAGQGEFDPVRLVLGGLVCALLFADALGSLGEALFQAHERMAFPARVEVATGLVRAGGALLALSLLPAAGLFGVFGCFLLGSAVRAWVLGRAARREFLAGPPVAGGGWAGALALVRESLGVALFRVLRMVRNRVDTLLLGVLVAPVAGLGAMATADAARGLYGQAMRVVFVFHTLTLALNTAVFPRLARLGKDAAARAEGRRQFGRVVRYQAWWASLLAALVFVYADELAGWFGPAYRQGIAGLQGTTGQALRILVAAVLLDSIGGPVGMLMVGRPEMDRKLPAFGAALASVSLVLNLILIPRWGLIGAAWSSLGAAAVELLIKAAVLRRLLGSARALVGSLPYLGLAAAVAVILAAGPLAASPILGGLAGGLVYLAVCAAAGLLDPAVARRLGLGRRREPAP
ncbi:MAG: hypothetical protein D6702_03365 [Planctomycetota bacterium]|nr:MAG: hypothetical protein D6702_03365 [Planctomycetota bacterium]